MAVVRLSEFLGPLLLFRHTSGVRYTHEVGGTALILEEIEGFAVPVTLHEVQAVATFEDRLRYLCEGSEQLADSDLDELDTLFASHSELQGVSCDRSKVSREAWVWLKIDGTRCLQVDGVLATTKAVLTWRNSD